MFDSVKFSKNLNAYRNQKDSGISHPEWSSHPRPYRVSDFVSVEAFLVGASSWGSRQIEWWLAYWTSLEQEATKADWWSECSDYSDLDEKKSRLDDLDTHDSILEWANDAEICAHFDGFSMEATSNPNAFSWTSTDSLNLSYHGV